MITALNDNLIVFNIETVTDPDLPPELLPEPPDRAQFSAPSNYKDPEKIKEYIEREFLKATASLDDDYAKLSLSPLTSRIVCLAYKVGEHDIMSVVTNEKDMIHAFNSLFENDIPQLVSFNGKAFDLPHIAVACVRNNLPISFNYTRRTRRYTTDSHIDLYEILTNFGENRKGKLSDWCSRLGISPPFGAGVMVKEWYEMGDIASIEKHCISNVRCTYELLKHIHSMVI